MSFSDGTTTGPPSSPPPSFGPVNPSSTTLTTKFTLHNMDALESAAAAAGITPDIYTGANGFADMDVVLKYYDVAHYPTTTSATLFSAAPAVDPVLTFNDLTYTAGGDWSALVYLNLQYIPFSQTAAPANARKWLIMNGLGKNASNGAVKVIAGTGGSVTVDIFTNF
jgi:hypothetical protein